MFFNSIEFAKDSGRVFNLTNLPIDANLVIRGRKLGKEKRHHKSKTIVLESVPYDFREMHLIFGLDGSSMTHVSPGFQSGEILVDGKPIAGGVNLDTEEHTVTWTSNCGESTQNVRVEMKIRFHPQHGTLSLTYHVYAL